MSVEEMWLDNCVGGRLREKKEANGEMENVVMSMERETRAAASDDKSPKPLADHLEQKVHASFND